MIKIEKEFNVERDILLYAIRYALNRSSYSSQTVLDNIKHNINKLSVNDIELFIKEIDNVDYYASDIDKKIWDSIKSYLEVQLLNKNLIQKNNPTKI